jgi:hypothetical protein
VGDGPGVEIGVAAWPLHAAAKIKIKKSMRLSMLRL